MNARDRKIVRICGGFKGLKELVNDSVNFDDKRLQKLYNIYQDEMPYGTQKARTGDPVIFILKELDQLYDRIQKQKYRIYDNVRVNLGHMTTAGFAMLQQQKLMLVRARADSRLKCDLADGLINFIDHIQDQCVDTGQVPESVVFPEMKGKKHDKVRAEKKTEERNH